MIAAARQLAEEIATRAWTLRALGCAFADPTSEDARREVAQVARQVVAVLGQDEDDQAGAQAAVDVMAALWPHCSPEHAGEPAWWRTPLGTLVARQLGHTDSEAVTQSQAAAMLGVTRGSVAQWVHRGTLDRHPDGGVLRASVLQRLARR